jgi:hypothetical protein
MNKDFKEALEKEAHEYASLPNDDNIYHELKTGFKDGAEWEAEVKHLQNTLSVLDDMLPVAHNGSGISVSVAD